MPPKIKTFVVGTYRTTPFGYKPPPPAVFPKNPKYEDVKSKVGTYINTAAPLKPKESSSNSSE
jgi:hypothetical protein